MQKLKKNEIMEEKLQKFKKMEKLEKIKKMDEKMQKIKRIEVKMGEDFKNGKIGEN